MIDLVRWIVALLAWVSSMVGAGQPPPVGEQVEACLSGGFPETAECEAVADVARSRTGDVDIVLFEDGSVPGFGCVVPEMGCI